MQPIRFAVFTFGGINLSETQVALARFAADLMLLLLLRKK